MRASLPAEPLGGGGQRDHRPQRQAQPDRAGDGGAGGERVAQRGRVGGQRQQEVAGRREVRHGEQDAAGGQHHHVDQRRRSGGGLRLQHAGDEQRHPAVRGGGQDR